MKKAESRRESPSARFVLYKKGAFLTELSLRSPASSPISWAWDPEPASQSKTSLRRDQGVECSLPLSSVFDSRQLTLFLSESPTR